MPLAAEQAAMLNRIIAFSLNNRILVLAMTAFVVVAGTYAARTLPIDVFPDLNRPTVTVLTEAPGLAPEEVELQVTRPLEYQLNGATGVRRVRSASSIGLSIVWVEFDWGSDIYQDRQVVAEKLQLARDRLPKDANPTMAPIASIMGEIMLIGLRSTATPANEDERLQQAMELRTWAEFTLTNRLRSIEGVAQVTVIGGIHKQYQVVTSPARLAAQKVSLAQLVEAVENATGIAGGGILEQSATEKLIRINARSLTPQDIEESTVVFREPRAVLIKDVADVRFAGPVARGAAGIVSRADGRAPLAVILTVQKQPHADTVRLTRTVETALDEVRNELPAGAVLETHIFKQADFIEAAVRNVEEAIRDGAIWVFLILFLFLWNLRTSLVTLTAIPLSILITALVFALLGVSLNTMTLGGIAVAVGELVDDAIVDVENIYRRLRERVSGEWLVVSGGEQAAAGEGGAGSTTHHSPLTTHHSPLTTIFQASCEVRNSIVYATLIVCLVVLPLFALSGLEGRMFAPLALGYLISLAASLVVSLTVTPVLASFLLPGARFLRRSGDPFLLRWLKKIDERLVRFALRRPRAVLGTVAVLAVLAVFSILGMGGEFLPPFNEGTLTINVMAEPGTNLAESERLGRRVEDLLLRVPEVLSVARRTGRAEMDEHAEGVNSSELDVRLVDHRVPRPGWFYAVVRAVPGLYGLGSETVGRPRADVLADIRAQVTQLPGVKINIGQPIAHRLDHVLSGVRAQIAVKVFGPDDQVSLEVLRNTAADIEQQLRTIPGIVDLQVEPQVGVPQVRLEVRRDQAQYYGLKPGEVARLLETAYRGKTVAEIIDGDRRFDLVVWYDEASRNDLDVIRSTVLETPAGKVALDQVVRVVDTRGPNTLNRENVQRRLVMSCNVQGRDLAGVVADIRQRLQPIEARLRQTSKGPAAYRIEYGGQFQAQQEANRRLLVFGSCALVGVFLLLFMALRSWQLALQVLLVNIPLAAIGSVLALLIANRPSWSQLSAAPIWTWPAVWLGETNLSVAHWIGFITLIGIVCRNGILMISHYQHLMQHEGESFSEKMIVRGSLERLAPVLMTAAVAIMGLVPLALGAGQTGKEILQPLAVVVIGGLLASALLDQIVTPATFFLFGSPGDSGAASSSLDP
jgi:Cu/Ag efflux pump CusA